MSETDETLAQLAVKDELCVVEEVTELDGAYAEIPRICGRIPLAGWFIVLTEFCERFAYYGASTLFQNYVQYGPPSPSAFDKSANAGAQLQPGALNRGQATATALNNFFTFWCYSTPLLGAFVSDQYLGKFKTIVVFSFVYMVGWLVLTSTSIPTSHESDGTPVYTNLNFIGFVVAITVIGIGTSGIKSVVSPMCADQIPEKEVLVVDKNGNKAVVSPALTIQHLYNWFYWAINVGAIVGVAVCVQLERLPEGYWKAFLIPACMFLVSMVLFISARKLYVVVPPAGSIFKTAYQTIRYAQRRQQKYLYDVPYEKQRNSVLYVVARVTWFIVKSPVLILRWIVQTLWNQVRQWRGYRRSAKSARSFAFLDFADPLNGETADEIAERTWGPGFPHELRQTLKACTIFVPLTIYWVCYNQMTSNMISQAAQMQRPHWLSNDLLTMLDPLSLTLLLPFVDSMFYPLLRKLNIDMMYMKRMTLGFLLGGLAMLWAAFVQYKIYSAPPFYDHPLVDFDGNPANEVPNAVSVWFQIPAYVLIAVSEIFASIASLEYSYTHAPKSMKCMVSALSLFANAAAALIGMALGPFATDPYLTKMYIIVGVSSISTGGLFWAGFKHFDEEDKLGTMNESQDDLILADEKDS